MKYYVGIDLGGTNIVAGVVDENYNILVKESVKTNLPRPAEEVIADMIAVTKKAVESANLTMDQIESVGVGTPGTANKDTGIVEYSNNLQWNDVPLVEMLQKGLNKTIYIENDANAAAFGEYMAGAGKGYNSLIAITLGTGVGGGVITDGKILTGFSYAGAELGHSVIVAHGRKCTCGREGCLEAYTSATGLINLTKEAMEADKDSAMWEICGGDINKVNGKTAFDGMRKGDAAGTKVVDDYIDYLAIGIANYINIFQPQVICIGGGICKEGDTLIKPLTEKVMPQTYARKPENRTKIIVAELGNDAGIIGAALLGMEKK
ncbi:MAG: ROK family protein [Massiliimalia sp.]|jgi:glucokinase